MTKNLRLSYSSISTWKRCPQKYHFQYELKIKSLDEGASLAFGTSIDHALNYLLEAKKEKRKIPTLEEVQEVFIEDVRKGWKVAFDVPKHKYTRNDFTAKVLTSSDWELIKHWEKELLCLFEVAKKAFNQKAFKRMPETEQKLWDRVCWISMKRKGKLMLESFYKDIFPNIKEVIAVQYKFEGNVGEDINLIGYIDLICYYGDYKFPIIFDIKTAAREYDFDSIKLSEQLLMYMCATGKSLDTNFAGFLIMSKQIGSDTFCSVCGTKKISKHKTCANTINKVRCGGEWTEIPKATTQVLIEELSDKEQENFLKDIGNVSSHIQSKLHFMNRDSCHDFGMCNFYALCHSKDLESVKWPDLTIKNNYKKENENGK